MARPVRGLADQLRLLLHFKSIIAWRHFLSLCLGAFNEMKCREGGGTALCIEQLAM